MPACIVHAAQSTEVRFTEILLRFPILHYPSYLLAIQEICLFSLFSERFQENGFN